MPGEVATIPPQSVADAMRERLIKQHLRDREAMPPSMISVSAVDYEKEAKEAVAAAYDDAALELLASIYQSVMEGEGQDSAKPASEEAALERALVIYKDIMSKKV